QPEEVEKTPSGVRVGCACIAPGRSKTPPVWTGFFLSRSIGTTKEMGMNTTRLRGVWLPLVTPFRDGSLDETSLERMVRHYMKEPIDGLILAATTGEGLTLDDEEIERLVQIT